MQVGMASTISDVAKKQVVTTQAHTALLQINMKMVSQISQDIHLRVAVEVAVNLATDVHFLNPAEHTLAKHVSRLDMTVISIASQH